MKKSLFGFIYLTQNLIIGKIYVGQHISKKNNKEDKYIGSGRKFTPVIKEHGRINFKRWILKNCYNQNQLDIFETYYIKKYDSCNAEVGYNVSKVGRGSPMCGRYHSEETKKKMSESQKGENNPNYGIHRFGKDSSMFGKHHTEESKKKISEGMSRKMNGFYQTHKGRESRKEKSRLIKERFAKGWKPNLGTHLTEERKIKMKESLKRFWQTKEGDILRKRLSDMNKGVHIEGRGGGKWSEERKRKCSELMKGRFTGEENSMYGRRWINNGVVNKTIKKNDPLPGGFHYGSIRKKSFCSAI